MYSIVMVAAMTASPEVPDFFFKKNKGCHGCYGGGCYGYSCGGCYGGCGGCGGCYGGCGGCWGGGWCGGCHGCHGYMTTGCWGSSCHGCNGCYGGYAVPAGTYVVPGTGPAPEVVPPPPPTKDKEKDKAKVGSNGVTDLPIAMESLPANRGQVVVRLPADAKLFADGQATTLGGVERVFQTPDLAAGRDFQYTLKIEYTEGTETKSATKQVIVRGGHRTVVDFGGPAANTVSSSVTVNLPAKAKLFVDGVATPATGGTHTFRTPELTRGKTYIYQFRAEVEREGKTEAETREVTFKGGEPVVVDFAEAAVRTASAR
jgi:uncharacterized protein (TIGR03000 family)